MGVLTHPLLAPAAGAALKAEAGSQTVAANANGANRSRISLRRLLSIYLVLPLCGLVYALDVLVFGEALLRTLPKTPRSYFLLSILFGTPHIVASNLIFVTNREYFRLYRRRALVATLAIIAFFGVGSLIFSRSVLFVIVSTATITHVVKQQIGIGNMVGRLSSLCFHLWSWSIIAASVILYSAILFPGELSTQARSLMDWALICFSFLIVGLAFLNQPRVASATGRQFLWCNTAMALASFFFYSQGYIFFAVIGPRLIHDGTAFVFYVVHDRNRHTPTPQNWLYRRLQPLRIGPVIAVPAIAIALTLMMQRYADDSVIRLAQGLFDVQLRRPVSFVFIGYLSMMHYYMEAFTWKTASPYRRYIATSA